MIQKKIGRLHAKSDTGCGVCMCVRVWTQTTLATNFCHPYQSSHPPSVKQKMTSDNNKTSVAFFQNCPCESPSPQPCTIKEKPNGEAVGPETRHV